MIMIIIVNGINNNNDNSSSSSKKRNNDNHRWPPVVHRVGVRCGRAELRLSLLFKVLQFDILPKIR